MSYIVDFCKGCWWNDQHNNCQPVFNDHFMTNYSRDAKDDVVCKDKSGYTFCPRYIVLSPLQRLMMKIKLEKESK